MTGENTPSGPNMNEQGTPLVPDAPIPDVEVELDRASTPSKPWGAIAGAGALVLALGAGAILLTNGESELDTAEAQQETVDEGVDPDSSEPAEDEGANEPAAETEAESEAADGDFAATEEAVAVFESEAMEDSMFYEGPMTTTAVFDGERFVALSSDGDGWMLRSSVDGLEWTEVPTAGLPDEGFMHQLLIEDGVLAGLMESYVDGEGVTSTLVSSTDGLTWTTADLPDAGENAEAGISGLAISNGQAVMLRTIYDVGPDPIRSLVEAGILTEGQEEIFCGFGGLESGPETGGPIEVLVCDYNEENFTEPSQEEIDALAARYDAATTEEERNAVERELEELWGGGSTEVVATIEPGDPLYAEIVDTWFGAGEVDVAPNMDTSVLAGPLTGPFTVIAELPPEAGYYSGIVESGGALFMVAERYDDARGTSNTRVLTSADGTSWAEAGALPAGVSGQLQPLGDALLLSGYDQQNGTPASFLSTDGAVTWSDATLDTGLFEPYTMYTNGPAGSVALTNGLLEPWEDFEVAPPEFDRITLTVDGYNLDIPWDSDAFTLTGPDGVVIFEFGEEELFSGDNPNVRENPISGTLTFLDPDTGEDLVTFTEEDWEAAYEEIEGPEFEGTFEEPETGTQLHFSVDGQTWTELDMAPFGTLERNSNVSTVAVGDDEAVFVVTTWSEPPVDLFAFEMEGREPTPEEIDAIELWDGGTDSVEYVRIPLS